MYCSNGNFYRFRCLTWRQPIMVNRKVINEDCILSLERSTVDRSGKESRSSRVKCFRFNFVTYFLSIWLCRRSHYLWCFSMDWPFKTNGSRSAKDYGTSCPRWQLLWLDIIKMYWEDKAWAVAVIWTNADIHISLLNSILAENSPLKMLCKMRKRMFFFQINTSGYTKR